METPATHLGLNDVREKDAPQLAALLKEMKDGLDTITTKIQALTAKVKAKEFPTVDGISYLEAKHLLLLNYCQSLVYYLLRKAKGFSVEGHPFVQSLVEIRLFLEKIRPIDKKLQYQIQKLTQMTKGAMENISHHEQEAGAPQKTEDVLKYRPNPEMLISNSDRNPKEDGGLYRAPKIAPALMGEDKNSKHERNALRREKEILRKSTQSNYMRDILNDLEGRPEEIRDFVGSDSIEVNRYLEKMEERAQQEEELYTRAPVTKMEKKKEKHLKKQMNSLQGLTDSFYDEIKALPFEDKSEGELTGSSNVSRMGKLKKRKRRH
ncbi:Sas10/Utp3/C1D [Quillaja saponaria]|uniref:Sas10/Utp3/C1D n=1 Tax=Quillaja saponaria TaxID=32244 RepID=A0AAD7LX10_QUISA|nr:Sas10/Utp3/C1D [Quillaja saponaria]